MTRPPRREPTPPVAPANAETYAVRMYRGLLGDCFLLTHRKDQQTFRALIDCGVLQCIGAKGTKKSTELGIDRIRLVAADLMAETGGTLDLMIATHEHYDHLSGFMLAFDILQPLTIKALWLAWTEKPGDGEAQILGDKTLKTLQKLQAILDLSANVHKAPAMAPAFVNPGPLEAIANLLQFYGEIDKTGGMALTGKTVPSAADRLKTRPVSCAGVLDWLKLKVGESQVSYLEPGQVVKFGIAGAMTANVLGPPRDFGKLKQLDPTTGGGREVYLTTPDEVMALDSTLKFQGDGGEVTLEDSPFSPRFESPPGQAAGFSTAKLYADKTAANRRIDGEWLGTAENLALKIDGDVNNTSLALALEISGGHVLLFPADAQVGNWLSWHDQKYPNNPIPPDAPQITATDLLNRTIFYKVGHHASHNATLRDLGLELMTSPHLTAMIPVVEETAKEQKSKNNPGGWAMPYGDLYARLNVKTRSRVLRGDGRINDEAKTFKASPGLFDLAYAPGSDPLWVEITTPPKA